MKNDIITARQFFVIYILSVMSPAMRILPAVCARQGGAAGWLAPLVAAVVPAAAAALFSALYKLRDSGDFCGILEWALGKPVSKLLLLVYLIWSLLLLVISTRYYSERLVTSLFTSTKPDIFIVVTLALVLVAARGGAAPLARFSEFSAPFFAAALIIFFVSLAPTFRLSNVLPVTYYDSVPVLRSALPVAAVWGLMTPLFFLAGQVENRYELKKYGRRAVLILTPASVVTVLAVVGSLGPDAASRMPQPFLKVAKLIDIMQSFDRFEAIIAAVWTAADFVLLTALTLVSVNIIKRLLSLRDSKYLTIPVVAAICALSLFMAPGRFVLERLSDSTAGHILSLLLCLAVPLLTLLIGKLRGSGSLRDMRR